MILTNAQTTSLIYKSFWTALSVDASLIDRFKKPSLGRIIRVFPHAVSILFAPSTIIHLLPPSVGNGPNRVILPTHAFGTSLNGMRTWVNNNQLYIHSTLMIDFGSSPSWFAPAMDYRFVLRQQLLQTMEHRYPSPHVWFQHDDHPRVQDRIEQFLRHPYASQAQAILGLGSGSTPMGDDALVGAMLAWRLFNLPIPFSKLRLHWRKQTTALSYEMLEDTLVGRYSDLFIRWMKSLVNHNDENVENLIAQLGGNSGKMIRHSFYHIAMQWMKENVHENILTYS